MGEGGAGWGDRFDGGKKYRCDASCELDWDDIEADDGHARTAPVGSYPDGASLYGALDMAGNGWEWVADWYDEDYYRHSPGANPQGSCSGENRGVCDGSWSNDTNAVRAANRGRGSPEGRHSHVGFRCARNAK